MKVSILIKAFLLITFNPSCRRAAGTCIGTIRESHWITSINGTIYPVTFCGNPSSRALVNPTSRRTSTISHFVRRDPTTTARLRERRNRRAPRRDSEFMCRRNVRRGIVCNSPVGGAVRNRVRDRSSCRAVCGSFHSLARSLARCATSPLALGCNYQIHSFHWHAFRYSCNIDLRLNLRYADIVILARNTSLFLDKKFASSLIFRRFLSALHITCDC